jgi:signal transduction histidine kinase
MTIRARLILWYAGVLLSSLLLMTGIIYYEFVFERAKVKAAGRPPESVTEEIAEVVLYYGVPTGILTIIGGWWLLRKALAPLNQLAEAAERLQIHNLREQLPCTGNGDEVDRLSKTLNTTTARLDDAFNRIREFTLHASHELKTPLAILHGEIEAALSDPATTPAQREMFASQLDEIQRLAKIVEGLTLLAKADTGQARLAQVAVQFDELLRDSLADAEILAHSQKIAVTMLHCDAVTVRGDRHRLRQLLLNLTDNAIKYNQPNGRIDLSLTHVGDHCVLSIGNTGPGIPAAMLARVFDRFYRGDASHSSQLEGSGLGLSIAEWIVKAHGGDIQIASELEKQTTVTVTLPIWK